MNFLGVKYGLKTFLGEKAAGKKQVPGKMLHMQKQIFLKE
jgi:hypothetical protein